MDFPGQMVDGLSVRKTKHTLDRYSELQEQLDTAQATFKIETIG